MTVDAAKALKLMGPDDMVEDPSVFLTFREHYKVSIVVWDAVDAVIDKQVVSHR